MAVPFDIRISAMSLESLLNIAMKPHDQVNLFDMELPDLLDQIPSFFFSKISEDILLNIFARLEDDPRHLARLSCVCVRFARVIKNTLWRRQCMRVAPAIVSDLTHGSPRLEQLGQEPPGGWGALQKLLVCCPGLRHAGVMLECWDFGLDRELGSSEDFRTGKRSRLETDDELFQARKVSSREERVTFGVERDLAEVAAAIAKEKADHVKKCVSEPTPVVDADEGVVKEIVTGQPEARQTEPVHPDDCVTNGSLRVSSCRNVAGECIVEQVAGEEESQPFVIRDARMQRVKRKKRVDEGLKDRMREGQCCSHENPHLACGMWNLTREQGNKLLASRFRADILYICDWPGCVHPGQRRKYKLFRGVFKNFKASQIWRNLKDLKPRKAGVCCAFCSSSLTWDMVSTFCLRRSHEYHDDGEPVVRAFVCENGHVAGAWTDRPLYNL